MSTIADINISSVVSLLCREFLLLVLIRMSTKTSNWISLTLCPKVCRHISNNCSHTLVLNKNELLFIPSTDCDDSLYKYYIIENKWIKWIKYPTEWRFSLRTASLSKDKQLLYIVSRKGNIIQFNLKTQEFIQLFKQFNAIPTSSSFCIDEDFHIFGELDNSTSFYKLNKNEKKLIKINEFHIEKNTEFISSWSTIYISSTKCVIILPSFQAIIHFYSLTTNKCTSLQINELKKFKNRSAVITKNEEFIIIIGMDGNCGILELKSMKIKISNIHCPLNVPLHAIIVNDDRMDEILIFGFVHQNLNHLPIYLIKLICKWYCLEMIHIFTRFIHRNSLNVNRQILHWKINVDDILMT